MGPLLLLSLLGLGAGWAMWDMFNGKDEKEEETPEPVEGEDFVLDGARMMRPKAPLAMTRSPSPRHWRGLVLGPVMTFCV